MTEPTTLYRLYSAADALLYVGIAGNPGRRFEQHRADKPWWGDVTHITLEHHLDRAAALAAELKAIRTENPRHNIAGRAELFAGIPEWEHRPLLNGAYLDTEQRPDHVRVAINRDDLALQLRQAGQPWKVPAQVAAAHERLASIASKWLWAAGLAEYECFQIDAGRWRAVHVAPAFAVAAQEALVLSELDGDVSKLNELAARLVAEFPASPPRPREEMRLVLRQEAERILAGEVFAP